ncbi:Growth-regulating factor 12 [Hordeum vulgare]|nr:Growth-regulating factor 12 [Hordeum vulgare]KAI5011727.1 hypothetical protein ZWY2020_013864 [Hordeum vulgare]
MTERRQEEHSPPSKLPRLSGADDDADANDGVGTVTMAAPLPLALGLGLGVGGCCSDSRRSDAEATRPSALTFMQRQELEHQVLIYRYFAANAPVPVHLVLPIWKSLAASSSAPQRFPSLAGLGSMCYDQRSSMEPEPDRCRRTDGKKWRCSHGVVPGHKYCERHVHRGRGRSRKPVEAAAATSATPIRAMHAADGQGATGAHAHAPPQRLSFSSPAGVYLAHGTARAT